MTRRSVRRWALRLLGPIVLGLLLATSDLSAIGRALASAAPAAFAAAVAIWLVITALKAQRWRSILRTQGIALGYRRALHWYAAGLFLGGVSPGRLGELVKVAFIRDLGHPLGRALFSAVMDRLLDLLALPAVVLGAMALYGGLLADELGTLAAALGLGAAGLFALWRWRRLLAIPIRALAPAALRARAQVTVEDFLGEVGRFGSRDGLALGTLTLATWVLYGASVAVLGLGLGLPTDPVYLGAAALLAALVGLLPVTVSGVGTRDAVFAVLLGRVGVPTETAIALATLVLGLNLAVIAVYALPYQTAVSRRSSDGEGPDPSGRVA